MVLYAFWFHAEAQSFPQRRKGIQRKVGGRIKGFVEGRCSLLFVFTQRRKGAKEGRKLWAKPVETRAWAGTYLRNFIILRKHRYAYTLNLAAWLRFCFHAKAQSFPQGTQRNSTESRREGEGFVEGRCPPPEGD